jgi:RNA polymerase-binding transcription factor DksA
MSEHNLNTREDLEKERDLLLSELKDIAVYDEVTDTWNAVPMQNEDDSDPNDMADRFEDFESRSSILLVLQERLKTVNEKLEKLQ